MSHIVFAIFRWIVRNLLNFFLIVAVLIGGKWLYAKWDQAAAAGEQLERLFAERPKIGSELIAAVQSLEQQLRDDAERNADAGEIKNSVDTMIKAKEAERDRLKKESAIAIKVPTTPEFKRMVVLETELAMLGQAKAQAQVLATMAGDVAGGKLQLDKLRQQKRQSERLLAENLRERVEIRQDHPLASRLPGTVFHDRLRYLDTELPALEKMRDNVQVRIDSLSFTVGLSERKLAEMRQGFLRGHGMVESAMAGIDAKIDELKIDATPEFKNYLFSAGGILLAIILVPIGIKVFFYFVIAPWAARQRPIHILPAVDVPQEGHDHAAKLAASGVSVSIVLNDDEELLLHSDYLQSSSVASSKRTSWVLNWNYVFTSLAAGMYLLTRLLPYKSEPTVVSSSKDAVMEVAVIEVREGAALVFHPRYLVGVVQKRNQTLRITSHWRMAHLQSWLTLQFRYLAFHGPAMLIVKGCRGVRLESAGSGRLINQAATLGFSADTKYSVTRCETFIAYWRGEQDLYNDKFTGSSSVCIYEEMPSETRKTGVTGRGLEGLTDSLMKVFGV